MAKKTSKEVKAKAPKKAPTKKAAVKKPAAPKKSVKAKAKKPKAGDEGRLFNCKIYPEERRTMIAKAKRFAGGNLSAWVRFAACIMTPTAAQATQLKTGGW